MNHYRFAPNYQAAAHFNGLASQADLRQEVGVYAAGIPFVQEHCGPLAQRFLQAIPEWYLELAEQSGLVANCDIRLHDLLAGQYPASPGWHCDAATRETQFSAAAGGHKVDHNLIGCISSAVGGVSNTEFLEQEYEIDSDAVYGNGVELWNEIDRALGMNVGGVTGTEDGILYQFDPWTLHRAVPARVPGLRLFFRMSLWQPPENHCPGISENEQVHRLISSADLQMGRYLNEEDSSNTGEEV
jgi:hypothetical protein